MADEPEDGEDDDMGAPPVDPRLRVWDNPDAASSMPPTDEERKHFGIPDAPKAVVGHDLGKPGPMMSDPVASANAAALKSLVDKFPNFDPAWPKAVQSQWFSGFEKLMAAGLK